MAMITKLAAANAGKRYRGKMLSRGYTPTGWDVQLELDAFFEKHIFDMPLTIAEGDTLRSAFRDAAMGWR